MSLGTLTVARPKKGAQPAADAAPAGADRVVIIHLKGTPAYAAWLDAAHKKTHIPKTSIFRLAVAEWAERNGIEPPPDL